MSLTIPIPIDNFQIIWLLIGMIFGRSFGKKLDHSFQELSWFKDRSKFTQDMIKRILDFMHHWWIGAFIWNYAPLITATWFWPSLETEIMWLGVGIFIDDIRDFRHVLDRYKKTVEPTKPPG